MTDEPESSDLRDLMEGRGKLRGIGTVVPGESALLPWMVLDGAAREIGPISSYLRDRMLGDASPSTCRSYAFDLLRWFRVLWAVDVGWEQVTEAETAALVGMVRRIAADIENIADEADRHSRMEQVVLSG